MLDDPTKLPRKFQEFFELGDGGLTDWSARLLSNRKERLMISGAGVDRMAAAIARARERN